MTEPGGILGEIVARKRLDVAVRLGDMCIHEMRSRASPTSLSLQRTLAQPGARFVCEIKRASPSAGKLASDVDVARLAESYRGAADAISVLTDTPFFGGSMDDLAGARASFEGPILAKDFIVDPRQVAEARIHGADAILVMLSVLSFDEAQEIIKEARLLGMDALVEVHDETELAQALELKAPLIGINNRNLKTLEVDLSTTERMAPLVPADRTLVAESGITNRTDVERLSHLVDAFLVGSSLMNAAKPGLRARELAFGRVKICGLTSILDTSLAADAGASFCGLIFVPQSPRYISSEKASRIANCARERGIKTVGIFRDEPPIGVSMIAWRLALDAVQLHGNEDESYIRTLKGFLAGRSEVWAARGVDGRPAQVIYGADRTLFDTKVDGKSGGTGQTFDWSLVQEKSIKQGLLAGGLNPSNIGRAARTGAWALDVGSGVEAAPGAKDPVKMQALFDALRPQARNEGIPCN